MIACSFFLKQIPKPRRQPWGDSKTKRMIKKQHKLHKKRISNPTTKNITAHTEYRNKLRRTIQQTKKEYITQAIQQAKHDPKQQARILNSILSIKNNTRTSPTSLTYKNKTYTDPKDIANALNDHYITIAQKINNTIPPYDEENEHIDQNTHTNNPYFTLKQTTIHQVTKVMQAINTNKASDIHKIKPAIIKDLTPFLAPILTTLFNNAINENRYPDALKTTKIIELYKSKNKTLPINYRPISLLPIIAKIFDTIINNQLMKHLTENNILSPTQYAFRPNSNTTTAIQAIVNTLHSHTSKHKPTLAIYVDLSKAYDTISHDKMIHKLKHEFNFTQTHY